MIIYNDLLINMVNMVIFPEGMSEFLTILLSETAVLNLQLGQAPCQVERKQRQLCQWSQYSDTWCGWMSMIDFCSVKKGFV